IWMHNEMLLVEGRKMSKSLGNFFTVRDLLERGVPGEVIRFVLLSTHYRKPMDWTETRRQEAEATLRRWAALVHAGGAQGEGPGAGIDPAPGPAPGVLAALADDLNTPGAIAALHALYAAGDAAGLRASAALMGFDLEHMGVRPLGLSMRAEVGSVNVRTSDDDLARLESRLQEARAAARASGDFAPVDALKAALIAAGVEVRMTREGVTLVPGAGFDPAALAGIG
ncbi:MAG: class I tRNA ligase family protein, partial [Alphaproteobacteria bacterium]|nr:class I tRNA ligase family protein [Alphaproteobacteria bacterium]